MPSTSKQRLSRRSDRQQIPLFCPPVREGASECRKRHLTVKHDVVHAGHGPTSAQNHPQLSCHGLAEEVLGPLSPALLRDADILLSRAPGVLSGGLYYKSRIESEIDFIRNRIEESEITCQWDACGDHLKIKEVKTHLVYNHDIKSNPGPYGCFWNGCSSRTTEVSSLVRHVYERHCPMYKWPCSGCGQQFTREETLRQHLTKSYMPRM